MAELPDPPRLPMTPARFQQLAALYDRAVALPAPAQSEWIDSACATDADLAAELRALLAAGRRPESQLVATVRFEFRAAGRNP